MKKLFTYLSVAMLAVAAASCQKELVVENGAKGNVTFTIQTPDVATKAIADGTNVNVVYYEVYKAGSGHANSIEGGNPLIDSKIKDFNGTATLKLNLLQNQDYVVLFWADVAGKSYYTTTDLRKVTVDYTGLNANDEARAAFCQKLEFNSSKTYSAKVTLVRPFAQINLGTTADSINPAINGYDLDIESSYMKVVGAATEFSVASMTTGSETTTVEFAADTVPHDFTPDSEVLTVNDVNYAYLGMNYILAASDAATVDVTYEVNTNVGSISRQIPAVPVKKNFRTNLLGNLLTQETAIEIVVDEKFNTPDQEPAPIYMAAANGGEFTLTEDVELPETLVIQSSLTLDLGGYSITGGKEDSPEMSGSDISAIVVEKGATLTIVGEGNIVGTEYGVYVKNGNVVVKGADIKAGTSAVQVYNGTATIEGGNFSATKSNDYVVNCIDAAYTSGAAKVNITGGTFVGFNPAANAAEGAGTNFCAEGYKAFEKATGVYTVIPSSAVAVVAENSAKVEEALDNKDVNTIFLNAGKYEIEMYANFKPKKSLTIVGTEGTKVAFKNSQVQLNLAENFTIKDCEILHMATKTWGMLVFGSGNSADGVYTVSNCTFNGVGTQGIYINETVSGAVYNIENCTFNGNFGTEGAITIQGNKDAKFTVNVDADCTFNNIPVTNHDNPDGSHKICLVPNTGGAYFDFTLNTDEALSVVVKTKAPYGNAYGIAHNGGVLDGNDLNIVFDEGPVNAKGKKDNYGIMTSGGTIKNMTISGVFRGIMIMSPTEDIYIDNVVFDPTDEWGNCYPINTGEGDGTHSVYVKDSFIAGWNSYGTAVKDVTFTNCQFAQGAYYTDVNGRISKPYVNAVYDSCDFCSKYYIDLSEFVGKKVTLKNCTVNGVKLTAQNWTSLVAPESTCGEGQISIELKDKSYMTAENVADYVAFE